MANKAILRMETSQDISSRLWDHCRGKKRPANAVAMEPGIPAVYELLPTAPNLGQARDVAHRYSPRVGRPPKKMVDFMMAAPPPYGGPDEWSFDDTEAWARRSVEFAQKLLGPKSIILGAWLHQDETSPHVHILAVPLTDDDEPRVGWNARLRQAVTEAERPKAKSWYGAIQTWYAEEMAEFGLERGQEGSQARHTRPDPAIAAETRQDAQEAAQAAVELETTDPVAWRALSLGEKQARRIAAGQIPDPGSGKTAYEVVQDAMRKKFAEGMER